ncbi:nuclear transport factor 2 family protein [Thiosocius teredinicola]|uniref:nuclear transport factor 2 family protein n=1 Tax=Thiosocius teredinicola TaxID=1973002 RepID=UPI000F7ACCD8
MEDFFRKYSAAFDAFDAEAIASLYRLPCSIADIDGVQVFSEKTQLIKKLDASCNTMRGFGYKRSEFRMRAHEKLGEDGVAANIDWRIITTGEDIDFRTLYVLHRVDGAWRIFNVNVYQ